MANELNAAIQKLKDTVRTVSGVQKAHLGILANAAGTKPNQATACLLLSDGGPEDETLTAFTGKHTVDIMLYWGIDETNQSQMESVELALATMWDRLATKFHGDDADRNLSETCTYAMAERYTTGFDVVDNKLHRVMTVPFEIFIDTHEV